MSYSYTITESDDLHRHACAAHGGEGRHRPQAHAAVLRQPSDADIAEYEAEVIEFLKAGYLGDRHVRLPARRQVDRADAALHGAGPRRRGRQ